MNADCKPTTGRMQHHTARPIPLAPAPIMHQVPLQAHQAAPASNAAARATGRAAAPTPAPAAVTTQPLAVTTQLPTFAARPATTALRRMAPQRRPQLHLRAALGQQGLLQLRMAAMGLLLLGRQPLLLLR